MRQQDSKTSRCLSCRIWSSKVPARGYRLAGAAKAGLEATAFSRRKRSDGSPIPATMRAKASSRTAATAKTLSTPAIDDGFRMSGDHCLFEVLKLEGGCTESTGAGMGFSSGSLHAPPGA